MDKFIEGISFELTRRCNLHCRWCSKGEPQNMDITKDIIDKTLDEISPYGINCIRITGGEPSLTPELLEYLIDEIISKKIKVYGIQFITNATITSDIIKRSIYKMLDYAKTIEKERQEIKSYFQDRMEMIFKSLVGKDIVWFTELSVWEHDNKATYENVKKFYNDIEDERYHFVEQTELGEINARITIEGRAENYKQFTPKELTFLRIIDNDYCIICDEDECSTGQKSIMKTLSISSNGNVFVGGMKSFEHIDEDYLFNIMDCNNDLWNRIDTWCWDHPIFRKANEKIEEYKALAWKKAHIDYMKDDPFIEYETSYSKLVNMIYGCEEFQKKYHKELPHLNHYELNNFCAFSSCSIGLDNGWSKEQAKLYLSETTGLDEDIIDLSLDDKSKMNNLIQGYIKINNDRAVNKIQNPIMKFFARLYVDM